MESKEPASRIISTPKIVGRNEFGEIWECDEYYGQFNKYEKGSPLNNGPWAILSITATDETARHDWREFQQLKNHFVGEEWEAAELYPAESRLKDPSNRFYLWCFPKGVLRLGWFQGRVVYDSDVSIAPQRRFPTIGGV